MRISRNMSLTSLRGGALGSSVVQGRLTPVLTSEIVLGSNDYAIFSVPNAITSAGRYLIGVQSVNDQGLEDWAITGAGVVGTGMIANVNETSMLTNGMFAWVEADGPTSLTFTPQNQVKTYRIFVTVKEMENLSLQGITSVDRALGQTPSSDDSPALTLPSLSEGQFVAAMAVSRDTYATGGSWVGDMAGATDLDFIAQAGNGRNAAGFGVHTVEADGDFSLQYDFDGIGSRGQASSLAIAFFVDNPALIETTATIAPELLLDGQSMGDLPGLAALLNVANWSSPNGAIQPITATITRTTGGDENPSSMNEVQEQGDEVRAVLVVSDGVSARTITLNYTVYPVATQATAGTLDLVLVLSSGLSTTPFGALFEPVAANENWQVPANITLQNAPAGVTLGAGSVRIDTDVLTEQTNTIFTVTATDVAFGVTRTAVKTIDLTTAPQAVIASTSYDDDLDVWSVTTTHAGQGDWHWARYVVGTTGRAYDPVSGWDGAELGTGSFAVGASGDELPITETGDAGEDYTMFLVQVIGTSVSNILSVDYTAGAPVVASPTTPTMLGAIQETYGLVPLSVSLPTTINGDPIPAGSKLVLLDMGRIIEEVTVGGNAVAAADLHGFNTDNSLRRVSAAVYTITGDEPNLDVEITDTRTTAQRTWLAAFVVDPSMNISFVGNAGYGVSTLSTTHTFSGEGAMVTVAWGADEWANIESPDATLVELVAFEQRFGAVLTSFDLMAGDRAITVQSDPANPTTAGIGTITMIIEAT